VAKGKQARDHAAHRQADDMCAPDAQRAEKACQVVCEIPEAERDLQGARAMAPDVIAQHIESRGKRVELRIP
jgi:hypothetical protein